MSTLNENLIELFYTAQKAEPSIPPMYLCEFKNILTEIQSSNAQIELDEHARKLYLLILRISKTVAPLESKKLLILASTFFDVIDSLNSMDIQCILSTYKQLAILYVQEQKIFEARTVLTQVLTIYKKLNELSIIDSMDQASPEWQRIQSILHIWHSLPDGILSHYMWHSLPYGILSHYLATLGNSSNELNLKLFYDAYHGHAPMDLVECARKLWTQDNPLNAKDKFDNTFLFYAALRGQESFITLITSMLFFRSMPAAVKNYHDNSERKGHVLRLWTQAMIAKENGDGPSAIFYYIGLTQLLGSNQTQSVSLTPSEHYLLIHSYLLLAELYDQKNDAYFKKYYLDQFFTHYRTLEKLSIHASIDPFDLLVQRAKKFEVYGIQQQKSVVFSKQGEELAKQYGFDCLETEGGGACFFHAVLAQLKQQKSQAALLENDTYHTADTLRESAIAHITKHSGRYIPSLKDNNMQRYIEQARKLDYWADEQLILALARTLNISIVILSTVQPDPIIIKIANARTTVFLVNHDNIHFENLIKNPTHIPSASIETLLEKVNIDAFAPTYDEPFYVESVASLQNSSSPESQPENLSKQLVPVEGSSSDTRHKSTKDKQTKAKPIKKTRDNGMHNLINFCFFDKSSALQSTESSDASIDRLDLCFHNAPLSKKPKR